MKRGNIVVESQYGPGPGPGPGPGTGTGPGSGPDPGPGVLTPSVVIRSFRPGVSRAVLQVPLSLISSLIE